MNVQGRAVWVVVLLVCGMGAVVQAESACSRVTNFTVQETLTNYFTNKVGSRFLFFHEYFLWFINSS